MLETGSGREDLLPGDVQIKAGSILQHIFAPPSTWRQDRLQPGAAGSGSISQHGMRSHRVGEQEVGKCQTYPGCRRLHGFLGRHQHDGSPYRTSSHPGAGERPSSSQPDHPSPTGCSRISAGHRSPIWWTTTRRTRHRDTSRFPSSQMHLRSPLQSSLPHKPALPPPHQPNQYRTPNANYSLASAHLYESLQSATPATQIDPEVPKVPRLSRKTPRRQFCHACHACHANQPWGLESATPVTQNAAASIRPRMRQGSAHLYEGLQSATPATQIDRGVPKVPRLSCKTPRRQFDPGCRQGSADLYEDLQSATPARQINPEVPRVPRLSRKTPRLPRKSTLRGRKYHACHAKRRGTQDVAKVPLTSMKVSKVPRLPRKSTLRCRKCRACHAKRRGVNSTQDVAKVPLTSMKVSKVPRLPRKSTLRCRKCRACHAKRRGAIRPRTLPRFRWPLWRSRKCHACHANRARGTESVVVLLLCWCCCCCCWWMIDDWWLMIDDWWWGGGWGGADGEEGRDVPQQKQKPHNTMWEIFGQFSTRIGAIFDQLPISFRPESDQFLTSFRSFSTIFSFGNSTSTNFDEIYQVNYNFSTPRCSATLGPFFN